MIDVRLLRKYLRAKRKLERKLDEIEGELNRIISQRDDQDPEGIEQV
jgi:exonuclease VII small subunit